MSKSLAAWLQYLENLHPRTIDLGLERVSRLANALNLTSFQCPVITVAGTNGKGSCIRLLESIYLAAGYRAASYTSPHLLLFNERLRLNGDLSQDQQWENAFEKIEAKREQETLSFFEFTTLAALIICQETSLDVLLLEVGLGGRLDAVNVVDSDLAVITTIDLDHELYLGNTRESISHEKSGVFREYSPVVCGDPLPPGNLKMLAMEKHCPFYQLGEAFSYDKIGNTWTFMLSTGKTTHRDLPLPRLLLQNAAVALMVIDVLQNRLKLDVSSIHQGLRAATLPGRIEISSQKVKTIFDVAHNPQACRLLAKSLLAEETKGKIIAVFSALGDKNIPDLLSPLSSLVDRWYIADLQVSRSATVLDIESSLRKLGVEKHCSYKSIPEALAAAMAHCDTEDSLLIFGSFYTVAQAKNYLGGTL